jgi:hypothetical protein
LAGFDDQTALRLVVALSPLGVEFQRARWSEGIAEIATAYEFDVIVISAPDHGPRLGQVIDQIRSSDSPSRNAGLVLMCPQHRLGEALGWIGRGVGRVVTLEDGENEWRNTVLWLLDKAQRFQIHAPVRFMAQAGGTSLFSQCATTNVSLSGMLVQCQHRVAVGSILQFEITLPGDPQPIRGEARVVRVTDPAREPVHGIGAQFLSFTESDRSRLRNLLVDRAN